MDEAMMMQGQPPAENPTGRGEPVAPTIAGAAGKAPFDPKVFQAQVQKYSAVIIHLMYSEEMKADLIAMIDKSDDPFITVPTAVNQVIADVDRIFSKQGITVSNEVRLAGSQIVLNDLLEIGKAKGFFTVTEEEIPELMEDTLQMYIKKGLDNGSIDPVQLQIDGESLMNEQQRAGGQAFAEHQGIPLELSQQQIMEQYGNNKAQQAKLAAEDKFSRERAKLVQQQQQQPQPQGGR